VSETSDFVSAFALGALGQLVMPFVEEPVPYIPAEGVKNDAGKVVPPSPASLSSCSHGMRLCNCKEAAAVHGLASGGVCTVVGCLSQVNTRSARVADSRRPRYGWQSVDPRKKKPAVIKEEADLLNKQL